MSEIWHVCMRADGRLNSMDTRNGHYLIMIMMFSIKHQPRNIPMKSEVVQHSFKHVIQSINLSM